MQQMSKAALILMTLTLYGVQLLYGPKEGPRRATYTVNIAHLMKVTCG